RIDVRRADHRGLDPEVLAALLDSLLDGVEPRDAGDLDDRDHLLLRLRGGEARQAEAGGGDTHQGQQFTPVHGFLPLRATALVVVIAVAAGVKARDEPSRGRDGIFKAALHLLARRAPAGSATPLDGPSVGRASGGPSLTGL